MVNTDQRADDIWWWATRKIYRSLRWQCKLAQRKDFTNFKKENDDMLGIFVMMNLTWVVISQERASLSVLKEKTIKDVPTSLSTLFGVLVED